MNISNRRLFLLLILFCLLIIQYLLSHQNKLETTNTQIQTHQLNPTPTLVLNLEGPYTVIKVDDGDTIVVSINDIPTTIRFVGLDTPEVNGPYRQQACWGPEASKATHSLLDRQSVYLEIDSPKNLIDKYGRELRYVYRASDHLSIGKYLIQNGFAREYTYQKIAHKYQSEFRQFQLDAQDKNLGLWSHCLIK